MNSRVHRQRAWPRLSFALPLAVVAILLMGDVAQAQIRFVSYNIAQGRGDDAALAAVLEEASLDDRTGPAHPVSIFVFQEVTQDDFDWLSSTLGPDYTAGTYTNSNEDPYGGAQAMFYRANAVTEISSGHDGTFTGAGRRARRWRMRLAGFTDPVVEFYVYSGHLKAGNSSSNQDERVFGMTNILNNIDEITGTPAVVLCGDFNFYSASEPAYSLMLSGSIADFVDPLGEGSWSGAGNALKHTQSPRAVPGGGLASGGLDDRFDFLVPTSQLVGDRGFTLIEGTVRSMGNDGNHYDEAINDGPNSYYPGEPARSNDLADLLHDASDHLPVAADFRIPATLDAFMFNANFGTVIAGATVPLSVTVTNPSTPAYAGGGSSLQWYLDGTGTLTGVEGTGTLPPGQSESYSFSLTTGSDGAVSGDLLIRSDDPGVQNQPVSIPISGTVLRPADASFQETVDIDWSFASFTVQADTGVQVLEVPIWNFGWDAGQASLDLDGLSGLDPPFTFVDGLTTGITTSPALLRFALDTDDQSPGTIGDAFQILTSDADLPGATDQILNLSLSVTVEAASEPCPGDINDSGRTDVEDLLALLDGFGTLYDIDDILVCLGDWNCTTNP